MKPLVIVLLCIVSCDLSGQFRIEKIGVVAGVHRITASYNHLKDDYWIKKSRSLTRLRVGSKVSYPLIGRLSMEAGVLLDNLAFYNRGDRVSYYMVGTDNELTIEQHSMVKLGVPLTLLLRTYQTEACVTFVKLTFNNQITVYEKEQFGKMIGEYNARYTASSQLSNSRSDFNFSNSDLEFSFGTYLNIKGIDAQFALEPKFSLVNYIAANEVNTSPDLKLYDGHTRIFGAIGFEVTIYKLIE